MPKFILGTIFGVLMSVAYVRYDLELPGWITLPAVLDRSLRSAATDDVLFDLSASETARTRALEVWFANQPKRAASLDRDLTHPLLRELERRRAIRRIRALRTLWSGYDTALEKPELRAVLERQHKTNDPDQLKRRMLLKAVREDAYVASWLTRRQGALTEGTVYEIITTYAALDAGSQ